MSTQSNAMPDSPLEPQEIAPAAMSVTRPLYWSVRRELWENRSIYIAPLVAGGVVLFGFLISMIGLPHRMRALLELDAAHQREGIAMPYDMAAGLIMGTALVVAIFYCLDALYGERRDRSILFWKSLPVSDLTTVLSKASIAILVLPMLAWAITVVTQWTMLLLSSAVLLGGDLSVTTLWTQLSLFQMSLMLLYHIVTVHMLWHAPMYCWLLLVSAWARRAAFLWAFLPPLAIGVVEKMAFNTSHFAILLEHRLGGGPEAVPMTASRGFPTDPGMHLTPGNFLISAGLWIGLGFAAVFLAGAVRLRRNREPI
jgi:ABC-2 type transport system permease protein